jgi:hypothetical protein
MEYILLVVRFSVPSVLRRFKKITAAIIIATRRRSRIPPILIPMIIGTLYDSNTKKIFLNKKQEFDKLNLLPRLPSDAEPPFIPPDAAKNKYQNAYFSKN